VKRHRAAVSSISKFHCYVHRDELHYTYGEYIVSCTIKVTIANICDLPVWNIPLFRKLGHYFKSLLSSFEMVKSFDASNQMKNPSSSSAVVCPGAFTSTAMICLPPVRSFTRTGCEPSGYTRSADRDRSFRFRLLLLFLYNRDYYNSGLC
jgi:hypothetical protein